MRDESLKNLPTVNLPVCNNVVIDLSLKINDVDFNSFDKKKIVWHTDHVERLVMMRMHLISLSSSLCHTKVVLRLLNTLWYEFWMNIYMIMYVYMYVYIATAFLICFHFLILLHSIQNDY